MKRAAVWLAIACASIPLGAAKIDLNASPYLERVFTDGERIEYSLSWLGIVGGSAVMTVEPQGEVIRIDSIAKSEGALGRMYPVRDVIRSLITRADFSTLRFEKTLNERGRHRKELTELDPRNGTGRRKGEEFAYTPPVLDPLSSIYYIRTLEMTPGKRHTMRLLADGDEYEIEAIVLRRENLKIGGTTFDTWLVEPKMAKGGIFRDESNRLLIWFTADSRRVPVRIRSELEFGHITATLRRSRLGPFAGGGAAGE
ncbi:MAG: DUF3108 domain-containing protein [Thermoanaerobaculia bacterium]